MNRDVAETTEAGKRLNRNGDRMALSMQCRCDERRIGTQKLPAFRNRSVDEGRKDCAAGNGPMGDPVLHFLFTDYPRHRYFVSRRKPSLALGWISVVLLPDHDPHVPLLIPDRRWRLRSHGSPENVDVDGNADGTHCAHTTVNQHCRRGDPNAWVGPFGTFPQFLKLRI